MKKIKLTQGQYALIDKQDYEKICQYKWHANYDPHTKQHYACTWGKYVKGQKRKYIRMHRFIMNVSKGKNIDHINHNTLDNRKKNLRICTSAENSMNKRIRKNKKYKGICFRNKTNNWIAQICINYKVKHIGTFKNIEEAALAYDKAAIKYHGKFAYLNTNIKTHYLMSILK